MLYPVTIANKRTFSGAGEYVGRPSELGNPYKLASDAARGSTLDAYRHWLWDKLQSNTPERDALYTLVEKARTQPITLICWCYPLPCHAEIIRDAMTWMDRNS